MYSPYRLGFARKESLGSLLSAVTKSNGSGTQVLTLNLGVPGYPLERVGLLTSSSFGRSAGGGIGPESMGEAALTPNSFFFLLFFLLSLICQSDSEDKSSEWTRFGWSILTQVSHTRTCKKVLLKSGECRAT